MKTWHIFLKVYRTHEDYKRGNLEYTDVLVDSDDKRAAEIRACKEFYWADVILTKTW